MTVRTSCSANKNTIENYIVAPSSSKTAKDNNGNNIIATTPSCHDDDDRQMNHIYNKDSPYLKKSSELSSSNYSSTISSNNNYLQSEIIAVGKKNNTETEQDRHIYQTTKNLYQTDLDTVEKEGGNSDEAEELLRKASFAQAVKKQMAQTSAVPQGQINRNNGVNLVAQRLNSIGMDVSSMIAETDINAETNEHSAKVRISDKMNYNEFTSATEKEEDSGPWVYFLYASLMLISAIINSILFKSMTSAMPNYSVFLSQVSTISYVPIFGVIVLYLWISGGADALGGREVLDYPINAFVLMGLLDAVACILSLIGGTYTTGSTQVVLSQVVIPVGMGLSYVILRSRYHRLQQIGASVMILGVICTKIPFFLGIDNGGSDSITTTDVPAFNLFFMLSVIPNAFSAIYKEMVFNDVPMNVNWMQFWVAFFQLIMGFAVAPFQSLKVLGPNRVPLSDLPWIFAGGFRCLVFGINTITQNCGGDNQPECDDCEHAWLPVFGYCAINILYNIFSLLVVKHGGATLSFLVATLRLPLTTLAFCSPWIMGEDTVDPSLCDGVGLLILIVGLVAYRYGAKEQEEIEEANMLAEGREPVHIMACGLDSNPVIVWVFKSSDVAAKWARLSVYNAFAITSPLLAPGTREQLLDQKHMVPARVNAVLSENMQKRYRNKVNQTLDLLTAGTNKDVRNSTCLAGREESCIFGENTPGDGSDSTTNTSNKPKNKILLGRRKTNSEFSNTEGVHESSCREE